MRNPTLSILFTLSFMLVSLMSATAQNITAEINALVTENYPSEGTAISLLVAKNGKTIYRNASGKSNLELEIDATPDNVFELGSITKQFTAVSILMLEEQGKLKVTDEIIKYIPDYPTQGNRITIYQLLNHTSGIKSYTSMKSFMDFARTDMTPQELIDVFKNEPMDFEAGKKYSYSNSGYILLGHIIEVVSGQSYEDFIQKNIFDALGMTDSYYGSKSRLIKGRASGYTEAAGMENAKYLSMTLPYAAGSLMSNVDDMLKWQNAMNANQLITKANYERATNRSQLIDGKEISYGLGWGRSQLQGSPMVHHGGGIFGYSTFELYLPDEDLYVIGLSNCDCGDVDMVTTRAAAIAMGQPIPDVKNAINLTDEKRSKWIGSYEFEEGVIRFITKEGNQIYSQRKGSTKLPIFPMSEDRYIFEDGMIEYNFNIVTGKKVAQFERGGKVLIGNEIEMAIPKPKKEITLDPTQLMKYVGKYELTPSFHIEVTTKDGHLFAQATGQPQFELFAYNKTDFFLKVVEAQVIFTINDKGLVTMMTLHQGGGVMPGKKLN